MNNADGEAAPPPPVTRADKAAIIAMLPHVTKAQLRGMVADREGDGVLDRAARAGLSDWVLDAMRRAAASVDAGDSAPPQPLPVASTIKTRRVYKRRPVPAN